MKRTPSLPFLTPGVPAALTAVAALLLVATPAQAHLGFGHATGFVSGLAHPLLGVDHLLAMLTVGLWAGFTGGRAVWLWPAAFVGMMAVAALMGMGGLALPLVEPGILASVVVLGGLLGLAFRMPLGAGALLVAFFAFFHGHAHGTEAPAATSGLLYVAGFALATAALHVMGIALAGWMEKEPARALTLRRSAASLVVASGILLALA
jgi:urease accessory protein